MPETELLYYREDDGSMPVMDWLNELAGRDRRAYLKCREVMGRLALMGHELRRPTADLLEDGLRTAGQSRPGELSAALLLSQPRRGHPRPRFNQRTGHP